jgi:hypothetical protein
MGLGDMLVLRGMIAELCRRHRQVALVVARKYLENLHTLFEDLDNLAFVPVEEAHAISPAFGADGTKLRWLEEQGYRVLPIGYHTGTAWTKLAPKWSRALYAQLGMPPDLIVEGFRLPTSRRAQSRQLLDKALDIAGTKPIVVVHDDSKRRLTLPPLPASHCVIHVDDPRLRSDNIFDYVDLLRVARHLHTIDSCFALLADLAGLDVPMTLHLYAKDAKGAQIYERTTHVTEVRDAGSI